MSNKPKKDKTNITKISAQSSHPPKSDSGKSHKGHAAARSEVEAQDAKLRDEETADVTEEAVKPADEKTERVTIDTDIDIDEEATDDEETAEDTETVTETEDEEEVEAEAKADEEDEVESEDEEETEADDEEEFEVEDEEDEVEAKEEEETASDQVQATKALDRKDLNHDVKNKTVDTNNDAEAKPEKPLKDVFILARPFVAFGRYLRDSWRELRQVRWPNRKATWKMTLAVIIYCAIFIIFIVLLDLFFTFIFNLILGQA